MTLPHTSAGRGDAVAQAVAALRHGGDAAILQAAQEAARDIAPHAAAHDREASFPAQGIARLWAAGLGALTIERAAGGVGASLATCARVVQAIAEADASVGLIYKWQLSHLRESIEFPPALRAGIVREALAGPALLGGLRAEPELGTPVRGGLPASRARRATLPDGRPGWRIDARKIYATGSEGLRWFMVWCATDPQDGEVRAGYFFVPAGTPGIEVVAGSWDQLGMRASSSNDVVFRDVLVPLDHAAPLGVFGQPEPTAAAPDGRPDWAWGAVLEAALYAGIAQAAQHWLTAFLNARRPTGLGAPLASLERFQLAVGEIELLLHANAQLIDGLAARIDAHGQPGVAPVQPAEPALTRTLVTRQVIQATELALSLTGNHGLAYRNALQRHARDALCGRVHAPQPDLVLGRAGRAALQRAAALAASA